MKPTVKPVDESSRERIRQSLDETLFVEAGAGTGKTSELVNRVLNLVTSGVEMRGIAAITFTEAAAAELRDRIRNKLDEAGGKGNAAAAAAVSEVDEAAISTLHSFAQRILTEHSLEAGLPPVFEVRDEIQSGLAFNDWWSATLDALLDDPTLRDAWHSVLTLGVPPDRFRDLARAMHSHWDRLVDRSTPAESGATYARLDEAIQSAVDLMATAGKYASECIDQQNRLCLRLRRMEEGAAAMQSLDRTGRLAWLSRLSQGKEQGKAGDWPGGAEAPREAAEAARAAAEEAVVDAFDAATRTLMEHIADAVLDAAEQRRASGELEFHDLLVLAHRVLRDHRDVRRSLRARWQRILIDEFQDTDPIQVEIAALLAAADEDAAAGTFPPLEPGRLFFVGDQQQSIYRFRRAEVELFRSVGRSLESSVVHLTQNFRSVPGVTDWVNSVIGPLLDRGRSLGKDDMPYVALMPARPRPSTRTATHAVHVLGGPGVDENLPAIRAREASEVARAIREVVGESGIQPAWRIGDGSEARDATYSDVAILLPTRTTLDYLEKALEEEQIPYRVESASLVWATQEVRDLLSVLRAIDDAGDEVAVVAALRSPALSCSDADLLEWAQAGGRWRVGAPLPESIPDDHPVYRGLQRLDEISRRRWWMGVSGLVEAVARGFGFFELALGHARSRDSWRRLRHVIDEARAFEHAGGSTLRQFLVWAEGQDAEGARVKEAVLPESDYPAVRIFTIHGAKGLEFPVCFLTGLNAQPARGALGRILWDTDGRMEAHFRAGRATQGFAALQANERVQERAEANRLLYVAATRARDFLIVSLHHKAETMKTREGDRSHAAVLWDGHLEHPSLASKLELGLGLRLVPAGPPPPPGDVATERREWSARREERIDSLRRSGVRAATELKKQADVAVERQPWQRGRGGTSLGRAVHATLQTIDLATGDSLRETARAQAAAEGISERAATVEARVEAALASDVAKQAAAARHWRELYLAAPMGEFTIEGYVDLLYETDDGLVLADWKTDALDPRKDSTEAVSRYGEQIGAYARLLETTLGRPVVRGVLVFLSDTQAVEIDVPISRAEPVGVN